MIKSLDLYSRTNRKNRLFNNAEIKPLYSPAPIFNNRNFFSQQSLLLASRYRVPAAIINPPAPAPYYPLVSSINRPTVVKKPKKNMTSNHSTAVITSRNVSAPVPKVSAPVPNVSAPVPNVSAPVPKVSAPTVNIEKPRPIRVQRMNSKTLSLLKKKKKTTIQIPQDYKFKKNVVFVSAGNNTDFHNLYIGPNMMYDIAVIYYGNNEYIYNEYKNKVNYIEKRQGSKFQNLLYLTESNEDFIAKYDYFFVLDDDIILDVNDINCMFYTADKFDLSICSPSFNEVSKISHSITKNLPGTYLRYTNFVEVNTPLFSKMALLKLLHYLDDSLIGWGIDYLSIWSNDLYETDKYAIVHAVECINPYETSKKNRLRELTRHSNFNKRREIWENFAKKIGCPCSYTKKQYKSISI